MSPRRSSGSARTPGSRSNTTAWPSSPGAWTSGFSAPPFVLTQRGEKGMVSLTFDGGSLFADAYLDNFDVSGQVGEFLVGTARFRLSGF